MGRSIRCRNQKALQGIPGSAFLIIRSKILTAALALLIRAASASSSTELQTAIQFEPIHMEIDFNGFCAFQEILIDDILIAVHIKLLIRVIGLIQSHGQAGAASAAFVQEDSNRTNLLILEICRNLFSGRRCYFEHGVLLKKNSTLFHQSPWDC